MAYMTVGQFGRRGGLSGLGEDKYKWSGGKAGEISPEGVPYGLPMEQAQPIIDAYNRRREAAAAGYSSWEEYQAARSAPTVAAPPPVASPAAVAAPYIPPPPYVEPPQTPQIPVAVPMPVEGAPATSETPTGGFAIDWKVGLGVGAAVLGVVYLFSRKKGRR